MVRVASREPAPHRLFGVLPRTVLTRTPYVPCVLALSGKQAYPDTNATCVDPKLHACSGEMGAMNGGTDLCTGGLDTLHCCAGTASKIEPGNKLCT